MLFFFQFSLLFIATAFAKVITLQRNRNITCVLTEEHTNRAVYLKPFSNKNVIRQNGTEIIWKTCDWDRTDSEATQFKSMIIDSRWNDLVVFDVKNYTPVQKKFDLSLSVCSVMSILSFKVEILENPDADWTPTNFNITVPRSNTSEDCSWVHFKIFNKNGYVTLLGESLEEVQTDLSANSWLRFSLSPNCLVKRHYYHFLSSDSISDEPSILSVQFLTPGQLCVHFYVSIDVGNVLNITLKSGKETIHNQVIEGFNSPRELREWKYIKIVKNFQGFSTEGTLYFYRQKYSTVRGYWAIDQIHYCPNNSVIYTATLDSDQDQATCHLLGDDGGITSKRTESIDKVGCLGGNACEVTCENVFGASFEYCQEHKICGYKEGCSCAWGYQGKSCREKCRDGTWGMNCLKHCTENCNNCNPINGICEYIVKSGITSSTSLIDTTQTESFASTFTNTISTVKFTISTERATDISSTPSTLLSTTESTTSTTKNNSTPPASTKSVTNQPTANATQENSVYSTGSFFLYLCISVISLIVLFVLFRCYLNRKMATGSSIDVPDLGHSKVSTTDLNNYIRRSLAEGYLVNQFNTLLNDSASCSIALELGNTIKNYDKVNVPYDKNRVVLEPMENVGTGDYINASYIDGWGRSKAYIVTQGPKSLTIPDFWRMIWQHDVKTIVMATHFRENMKRECVEYFPLYLNASLPVNDIGIKLVKEEFCEFYEKRILEIYYQRYHKVVTHYQMTWKPEMERPLYPNYMVPLVQIMNENYKHEEWNPVVVHCSLGVGRSAILVLCDIAFEMAKRGGYIDVYDAAKLLREQRPNMITSSEDYILAHLVISECLLSQVQVFNWDINQLNALSINRQLEYLTTWKWHDDIVNNLSSNAQCSNVPYVEYLDRYEGPIKYYYTKQPQPRSMDSFWRRVLREKIKIILLLNETAFKPCPFRLRLSERRFCIAEHVSSTQNSYCVTSRMLIKDEDIRTTTLYEAEIVFHQLLGWKSKRLKDTRKYSIETLIKFIEDVRCLEPASKKILVCCSNGISDCGFFIALSFIIRRYLKEVEYDIPNTLRSLRRHNIAFISKSNELRILYEAIEIYSQKFDPYNNIENDTSTEQLQ